MRNVLFKLDEFCRINRIDYVVTGTVALSILGVPHNTLPNDMDIKVIELTDEQRNKLSELQFLAGVDNECYESGECFAFYIDGIKINVLVDNTNIPSVTINLIDKEHNNMPRPIKVQLMQFALADKMKLNRPKDKAYLLNLIHLLTSLV